MDYLLNYYYKYPLMRVDDFLIIIYESVFGSVARTTENGLNSQFCDAKPHFSGKEDVIEVLSEEYSRVNVVPYCTNNYSLATLAELSSKNQQKQDVSLLLDKLDEFIKLVKTGLVDLPLHSTKNYVAKFKDNLFNNKLNLKHSHAYNFNYFPCYTVIETKYANNIDLINSIDNVLLENLHCVVGCTSNSTADILQSHYQQIVTVVQAEDFNIAFLNNLPTRLVIVVGDKLSSVKEYCDVVV